MSHTTPPHRIAATLTLTLLAVVIGCQQPSQTTSEAPADPAAEPVYAEEGVAIKGYDPVAYFNAGAPTVGSDDFTTTWKGAEWRFASVDNLTAFKASPEKYAPQYGGYCAWGVAEKDELFPIDPQAWKIVDEKLYLNFNADIQKTWLEDTAGFINTADEKWAARIAKAK